MYSSFISLRYTSMLLLKKAFTSLRFSRWRLARREKSSEDTVSLRVLIGVDSYHIEKESWSSG